MQPGTDAFNFDGEYFDLVRDIAAIYMTNRQSGDAIRWHAAETAD
jgi:hypothetical protein